ncbi:MULTISPECIES: hypothetical protein [unclassified Streptomyces]|uniref:hypothetical protein n=1 Tax=unclassified Streptomyces TaxID=2593676 RepID=UPI002E369EC5|nr:MULTISPECIES: hypothetical protein [unclassified Streptomyces]WUC63003.1 hypothetical protein OG861_01620 [Streptomyces sp. NBC_00539]
MSEVIESLAHEGGTVLVTALATGLVGAARRLPQLWRREGAEERMAAELERSARELADSPPETPDAGARVAVVWETRLRDLLLTDPAARGELEQLLADMRREHPQATTTTTQHITASAPNSTAQGVIGGSIHNHAPAAPPGLGALPSSETGA